MPNGDAVKRNDINEVRHQPKHLSWKTKFQVNWSRDKTDVHVDYHSVRYESYQIYSNNWNQM